MITSEQLHAALRKSQKHFIILDCRSSHEYTESHIRTAVNFSIPSIMLRRFAAGKIDITSTIKCRDLKERILSCYKESTFVLYNNSNEPVGDSGGGGGGGGAGSREELVMMATGCGAGLVPASGTAAAGNDTTINVLHRKLKQDGCRVVCLEGKPLFCNAFLYCIIHASCTFRSELRETFEFARGEAVKTKQLN